MSNIKFDVDGARAAGYTDAQIAEKLAEKANFDVQGARAAGFKDDQIIGRLAQPTAKVAAHQPEVEDPGALGATLIGAGRTVDRIGKGMKQLYYGATNNTEAQAKLKAEAEADDEIYNRLKTVRPIATSIGEAAPSMIVPVGGAATTLGVMAKLAASGAIPAALEYGSASERAGRAATAGAGAVIGGAVIPKAVGMAASGVKSSLKGLAGNVTPEALALAGRAEQLGISVNAAQLGDSKFLKTLASAIEQMPFTGGAKINAKQQSDFTRAVSKTFGDDVEKITPEVYAVNKARLKTTFDDLAMRNTLNVDDALMTRLDTIMSEATQMADDGTIKAVDNVINRLKKQSTTQGKLYHGGTYNVGDDINRPLFTAPHPDSAKTYVDMATDRGMKSPKMTQFDADLKLAAPESVVFQEAEKLGIDPQAGTPASVFDSELHGDQVVNTLVKNLKKIGYNHANLDDIPYGQGKEFTATIIFPGVKTSANATGTIEVPGAAYSSIDSMLSKAIKSGGEKGNYLGEVQKAIRLAMDDSIAPADQEAWKLARNQYKNLKAVRDIVARDAGDGNVPPMQLLNALNNSEAGKEAMAMGTRGTLGELGRIGRQFVRDPVPNSGTAQRALAMGLIGGGGYAFGADPLTIAGMLAGGATAGRTLSKVMNNPRVVQSLAKQGISMKDLAKMPPSRIAQIIGGTAGMATAESIGD